MKPFASAVIAFTLFTASFCQAAAADSTPAVSGELRARLTVELWDGSVLQGQSGDPHLLFTSEMLGEIKLPLGRIRSVVRDAKTNSAIVTTSNGDKLAVRDAMKAIQIETSFGRFAVSMDLIKRLNVHALGSLTRLRPGLVALWSGENQETDSLGRNNAQLVEMDFADGQVGRAFALNGTGSHGKIADHPSLNVGLGEGFTVSMWIKPSDVNGLHPILEWNPSFTTMPGVTGVSLQLGNNPQARGVLQGYVVGRDGRGGTLLTPPGTIVAGQFQFIALTYDRPSGRGVLYLNGAVMAQAELGNLVPVTVGDLWISRRPSNPGDWTFNRFFAGLLDEIAIYDRALSAAEIQAIGREDNGGQPLTAPALSFPGRGGGGGGGRGLTPDLFPNR